MSLITIIPSSSKTDTSTRRPALGVFVPLTDDIRKLLDSDSESDSNRITAFPISDIAPVTKNPNDNRVLVTFGGIDRASETLFEFSIHMEIQFLALSMSLLAVSDVIGGLPIYVMDSDNTKNTTKASYARESVAFSLLLPEKETERSEELQEKLETLISSDYVSPLAPIPWDMVSGNTEISPVNREAQSILFMDLIGLARGELSALMNLINAEDELNEVLTEDGIVENDNSNEDDEEDNQSKYALGISFDTILIAYYRAMSFDPAIQTAAIGHDSLTPVDYNPGIDIAFSSIVEGLKKSDGYNDIKIAAKDKTPAEITREENIVIWNKSLITDPPEQIAPLLEYISQLEDSSDYFDLLELALEDNDEKEASIEKYGFGKVRTVLALKVAAYSLKKGLMAKHGYGIELPAPFLLLQWINIVEDDFVWEVPALAKSLANYNFNNAVDVLMLNYKPYNDINMAGYLWATFHALGHHLTENTLWEFATPDILSEELDKLENNTQEFADFKSLILRYMRKIVEAKTRENTESDDDEQESDNGGCAISVAMNEFIDAEMDLEKFAATLAMAFPVCADILALQAGISLTDESWDDFREAYITQLLHEVAANIGERPHVAIR